MVSKIWQNNKPRTLKTRIRCVRQVGKKVSEIGGACAKAEQVDIRIQLVPISGTVHC